MAKKSILSGVSQVLNPKNPGPENVLNRLTNVPQANLRAPLQIDVEKYTRFAPNKNVPTYADPDYIQDIGANYQGNLRRNLSFLPRMTTTALFEVGQMVATPLDFVLGRFFNNDPYSKDQNLGNISKGLRDTEEHVKEAFFPILYRSDYDQKSFLQQISSSEFVGDELAQGAGFFAGMAIPGGAIKALGGFKALSRGLRKANYATINAARKSDFWRKTMEATRGTQRNRWMMTEEVADKASLHSYTAYQTFIEASAEASFAKEEAYNALMQKKQNGEINPNTGQPWTTQDVEDAVSGGALTGMDDAIYWYNLAVLGVSNTIMNNMLFGARALKGAELSDAMRAEKALSASKYRKAFDRLGKFSSAVSKGVLSEGFWEEGMQTAGEMAAKAKMLQGQDPTAFDLLTGFLGNYEKMVVTNEGQKSIFIGSLLGAGPSALEKRGEIKRAKEVYELLEESRNNMINAYLKPLSGDIYERDEKTGERKYDKDGNPILRVANILKDADQHLHMQMTALQLQALAQEDPEAFKKYIKEQIVPQLIKSYVRFDETLEMLEEDLETELKAVRAAHPDLEYILSLDEIRDIGRQMRSDRKAMQSVADMYMFSSEAKADLQSENKETQALPQEFAEEVIFDPYLDITAQIRNKKQEIAAAESAESEQKLQEDLEKLEHNKELFENMNRSTYNNLYKRWKENRRTRYERYEVAAAAIAEADGTSPTGNLTEDGKAFWDSNHQIDVYGSSDPTKPNIHMSTSEFELTDKDGNVVDTNLRLMPPAPSKQGDKKDKPLRLVSPHNEYELRFENGQPVITHVKGETSTKMAEKVETIRNLRTDAAIRNYQEAVRTYDISQESVDLVKQELDNIGDKKSPQMVAKRKGLEAFLAELQERLSSGTVSFSGVKDLKGHGISVTRTAEEVSSISRKNIAQGALETMVKGFKAYLKQLKSQKATTNIIDFEDQFNELIEKFRENLKSLSGNTDGALNDFFEKISEVSEKLEKDFTKLDNALKPFVQEIARQVEALPANSLSPSEKLDLIKSITNQADQREIPNLKVLSDLLTENSTKDVSEAIKKLTELHEKAVEAKEEILGSEVELIMVNNFRALVDEIAENLERTYGEIDADAVKETIFKQKLVDVMMNTFAQQDDIIKFDQEVTEEDIIKEGNDLNERTSDKPEIGEPGSLNSLVRPALDERSNEAQLAKYEAMASVDDPYQQNHKAFLENARNFHQVFRHRNRGIVLADNSVMISVKSLLNGSVKRMYGEVIERELRSQILFFHGKTSEGTPKFSTVDNIPDSDLETAYSDQKIVLISKKGKVVINDGTNPNQENQVILAEHSESGNIIYASTLGIRDLEGADGNGKPSFLYKREPETGITPRYRNLDESRIQEYIDEYQRVRDAVDKGPVQMTAVTPTLGKLNDAGGVRVSYKEVLHRGDSLKDFLIGNNMIPKEFQNKTIYELYQAGFLILADEQGAGKNTMASKLLKPGFNYLNLQGITSVLATDTLNDSDINNFLEAVEWISENYKDADVVDIQSIINHFKTKFFIKSHDRVLEKDPKSFSIHRNPSGAYVVSWVDEAFKVHEYVLNNINAKSDEFKNSLRNFLMTKNYSVVYANKTTSSYFYDSIDFSSGQPEFKGRHTYEDYINKMGDKLRTIFKKNNNGYLSGSALTINPSAQFTPYLPKEDASSVGSNPNSAAQVTTSENQFTFEEATKLVEELQGVDFAGLADLINDGLAESITLPEGVSNTITGENILPLDSYRDLEETLLDQGLDPDNANDVISYLASIIQSEFIKGSKGDLNLKPFASHGGVMTRVLPKAKVPVSVEHVLSWFKQRHPDAEVTITDDPVHLGQLSQGGDVIFSKREPDALYHEAWHRTSMYFLSPEQRAAVYQEVRERLGESVVPVSSPTGVVFVKGTEMTDNQAEEYLADEFRKYMLYGKNYAFPPKAKKQKSLFEKIVDFFKSLIRVFTGEPNPTMEHLFYYAKTGEFKNSGVVSHVGEFYMLPGLSEMETMVKVSQIDQLFMQHIWSAQSILGNNSVIGNSLNDDNLNVTLFWKDVQSKKSKNHQEVTNILEEVYNRAVNTRDKKVLLAINTAERQGKRPIEFVRERLIEEHATYLKRKGYGVTSQRLSVEEIEEQLQSEEDFADTNNTDPNTFEQSEEQDRTVAKNTNSWNRSKDVAKTTPPIVKAFFEGLLPLDNLRDIPALEMQAMFTMKVVIQNMQGMPMSQMIEVLEKMARQQPEVYGKLLERWKSLKEASEAGSEVADIAMNQIYRAIRVSGLEFITVSPGAMTRQMYKKQIGINIRTFDNLFKSSEYINKTKGAYIQMSQSKSGERGLLDLALKLQDRKTTIKQALDEIESLFGPVLRRSPDQEITEDLIDIINLLRDGVVNAITKSAKQLDVSGGMARWSDLRASREYIGLVHTMADAKYVHLDRAGDMSIPNLKGVNQKTRKYAMGESTHLTNILDDINGIQVFTKHNAKSDAKRHLKSVLVKHGLAKNTMGDDIVLFDHHKNSLLINEIVTIASNHIETNIPFELAEQILMGFDDSELGQSKAFDSLSKEEIISAHIKTLVMGNMPMVGTGGRERESTISFRIGDKYARENQTPNSTSVFSLVTMGMLTNQDTYVDPEKHLYKLFIDETARVVAHRALMSLNPNSLPNSLKANIERFGDDVFNYVAFQDVYQFNKEALDSVLRNLIDEVIESGDTSSVHSLVERALGTLDIQKSIEKVFDKSGAQLLEELPKNSDKSPYRTVFEELIPVPGTPEAPGIPANVPGWVVIAPYKDIIFDEQFYLDPFTGIHFSGVMSEDHELFTKPVWSDLKDKYVINTDLFAIKSGIEDTDRSFFLNHVAAKYNWPDPVKTVDNIAETGVLTKEQAEQVMREIQILFKVSAIETTSLSMGSVSVFKDLKSVTRRLEIQGSTKGALNTEYSVKERFDGKVSADNTMKLRVLPDITGKDAFKNLGKGYDSLVKHLEALLTRVPKDSLERKALKSQLDAAKKIKKGDFEGTDALSLVSLDYYRELLYKDGSWLPGDFEKQYVAQMYFLTNEVIKINKSLEEGQEPLMLNGEIVDESIYNKHPLFVKHGGQPLIADQIDTLIPLYKGEPLDIRSGYVFKSLKPQGTGQKEVAGQSVFTMMKTAFTPLIPSEHAGNPEMIRFIWENTIAGQVDVLAYESAVKETLPQGDNEVNTTNFGIQFKEPWSSNTESAISKQLMAGFGMDLHQNGMFSQAEKQVFEDLDNLFNKDVSDLTINNAARYFESIGVAVDFQKETVRISDQKKFSEKLTEMADVGIIDRGSLKQIEALVVDNGYIDGVIPGQLFTNVFTSAIEKKVITLRDKSAKQFVQEADTTGTLKFWRFENKQILPPQVKMPVPKALEPWILNTFGDTENLVPEVNYYYAYKQFREAFRNKDSRIPESLYQAIINRTPMDNRHSATPVEIADMLMPWEGSKVVVPMELVFVYGFDFDFDKLTTYVQTPTFDKSQGTLTFDKKLESQSDLVDKVVDELSRGSQSTYNRLLFYGGKQDPTGRKNLREALDLFNKKREKALDFKKNPRSEGDIARRIGALNVQILQEELQSKPNFKKINKFRNNVVKLEAELELNKNPHVQPQDIAALRVSVEEFVTSLFKSPDFSLDLAIFQSKKAIINSMYKGMYDSMMMAPAVMTSMVPVQTENIKGISEKALGKSDVLGQWSDLFDISKNAEKRSIVLASGSGIGILASFIPMFARMQKDPIRFNDQYQLPIRGYDGRVVIGGMYDKNGRVSSTHLSEFLNAFLDVTKELEPFYAGLDEFVAPVIAFMLGTGTETPSGEMLGNITPELVMEVLNQPIIKTFVSKYKSNVKNMFRFGSKSKAREDAFAYALAMHNISPLLYINPVLEGGSFSAEVSKDRKGFTESLERDRISKARIELNIRKRSLRKGTGTSETSPFLHQAVEATFYKKGNKGLANQMNMMRTMSGISSIDPKALSSIRKAYDTNSINDEIREAEVATLDAFVTMMLYSDRMTNFMLSFRKDAGLPRTVHQLSQNIETRQGLMSDTEQTLLNAGSVRRFKEGNYLNSFIKVNNVTLDFLKMNNLFYKFDPRDLKTFFNQFGFEVGYDQVKEYFPSFLIQKYVPEIDEVAKTLLFQSGEYNDSLQGLYREFEQELRREIESNGGNIKDDLVYKNLFVEATTYDRQFKKTRVMQKVSLANDRIQGWELDSIQERVAELTNENATENQDLVRAAKKFFDAASVAMVYQNAGNRFSGIGKVLVNYSGYTEMVQYAMQKFDEEFNAKPDDAKNMLNDFAKSIAIAKADDSSYVSARRSFYQLPRKNQADILKGIQFQSSYEDANDEEYSQFEEDDFEGVSEELKSATTWFNSKDEYKALGLRAVQPNNFDFGDNYVAIQINFKTDPDRVTSFETNSYSYHAQTVYAKQELKPTSIDFVFRRVPIRNQKAYAWHYVGATPVEGFYAINPQKFMDRRAQVLQENTRAGLTRELQESMEEQGVTLSRRMQRDPNSLLAKPLFENEALYSNRTLSQTAAKAALQMIPAVGTQLAEKIADSMTVDSLVNGVDTIFKVATNQMEVPREAEHPMMQILRMLNDTSSNVSNVDLWSSYSGVFTPHAGTPVFKAMEAFNAAMETKNKPAVKRLEISEEKAKNNEEQLELNLDPLSGIRPEDAYLFAKDESSIVVDAFYNFDEYFPGVEMPNDRMKLAFLRLVDNGTIEIKCKV